MEKDKGSAKPDRQLLPESSKRSSEYAKHFTSTASWMIAAGILAAFAATAGIFLTLRRDPRIGQRTSESAGAMLAKGAQNISFVGDPRNNRQAQRVAIDGFHPETPAPAVSAGGGVVAPPPPPPSHAVADRKEPPAPYSPPVKPRTVVILKIPSLSSPVSPAPFSQEKPLAPPSPAPASPAPQGSWEFEGRIYDLLNLNSVFGARLVFTDPDGKESETTTSGDGQYRIRLNALDGRAVYRMRIYHPDYENYLDDIDPPFSQAKREVRIVASKARSSKPWAGKTGWVIHRNLVGIPRVSQ